MLTFASAVRNHVPVSGVATVPEVEEGAHTAEMMGEEGAENPSPAASVADLEQESEVPQEAEGKQRISNVG